MNIKPMFENETLTFATPVVQVKEIESKVKRDTKGDIPNGIFKVLHWEKKRQITTAILSGAVVLFSIILIILYSTAWTGSWALYIFPSILLSLSLYKLLITNVERTGLSRSVSRYREDLNIGLDSTPPFIAKLYLSLNKKQVKHNWITFALVFYVGIMTLLLWWLKDTHFWIFKFDEWIQHWFKSPTLMSWLFTISLISITLLYVYMTIQRKKRILEIDAYFGSQIMKESELVIIRQTMNKFYRRIFILSVMIILLIPIFVKIVLRLLKK